MICRHCGKAKVNRPRGLCWKCYYTPGVRELCPITSKYAAPGIKVASPSKLKTPKPTKAQPGSPEKLAVLEARLRSGQALWHPLDSTGE